MDKAKIIDMLWQTYIRAIESEREGPGSIRDEEHYKPEFMSFAKHRFPFLFEDMSDEQTFKPRAPVYWHEWGCWADIHKPNKTHGGLCNCIEPENLKKSNDK